MMRCDESGAATQNQCWYDTAVNDFVTISRLWSRETPLAGAEAMSTDNEWWTWIVIGTIFLLTTPATYIPVAMVLGFF
jgi:hypothetical protein